MKLLKGLSYNNRFEKWNSPYQYQDYNTLYSEGMFYFSNDQYLKKFFSNTDFPFRFVKDFFKVQRNDAKEFFASKLPRVDLSLYVDRETHNFIYLSNDMVYENYGYLFNDLVSIYNWKSIRFYSEDDLVSKDVYCFITQDSRVMIVSVSLIEESVGFTFGEIYNNQLYLFPNDTFSLKYEEFRSLDAFIEHNLFYVTWKDYFHHDNASLTFDNISLTFEEFVEFLKTSGMAKVRSGVVTIYDDYMYDSYMSDILPDPIFNTKKSDYYTFSPFMVGAIFYFINLLLHSGKDFNIEDVYWLYRKVLASELYALS